jgi:hypothetical protein
MKGFSHKWDALIHNFVSRGSMAIKVNDDIDVTSRLRGFETMRSIITNAILL